ncbi:hypothetical protein [Actinoplanes sp. NPDC049118]|uniref:hypothetical protein n=1 Tax=Actinoplanes sp. NPDC049118 TaxID=3155769 RepID=UPI00340EF854
MRTRSGLPAVVAVSVALVAGCGDASGHARPDVPHPFGGAAHIPVAERRLFAAAEEELVADCMRGRGLRYLPQPPAEAAGPEETGAAVYGLIGPREARLHGYGMGERLVATPSSSGGAAMPVGANAAMRAAMTARERRAWDGALLGTPGREARIEVDGNVFTYAPDACVTRARQDLFGTDWDRLRVTAEAAVSAVAARVWRDPAMTAAVARWSECMAGKGHDLRAPAEARAVVDRALSGAAGGNRAGFAAALRLEHETAIADADCQCDSGIWEAVVSAQRAAERGTPATASAAVSSLRAARVKALEAARRITATAPPPTR